MVKRRMHAASRYKVHSKGRFFLFYSGLFCGNAVFLSRPGAQVGNLASLGTKWPKGVSFPFRFFSTDRACDDHENILFREFYGRLLHQQRMSENKKPLASSFRRG